MRDFELFKRLTRLYFAAASFSETARRLDRAGLAPGFLLGDHPTFGPELRSIAAMALDGPADRPRGDLLDRIDRAIEPFDIAGLGDDTRRDWYPVLADDLLASRHKLGASEGEIDRLLERCGFRTAFTS
jgi:FADH2 O2-dependent halogenase